jgi:hypothetical protein
MAQKMSFPQVIEKVIGTNPKNNGTTTGFVAPESDSSWTSFFTYEGDDDRFVYGVKKGLTEKQALANLAKEEGRQNGK